MATVLVGSTAGLDSSGTYAAATTSLVVARYAVLHSLKFWAVEADTYTLKVDTVTRATVVASAGEEALFDLLAPLHLNASTHTVAIVPAASRKVRYQTGTSEVLLTGVTSGLWNEYGGFRLPWVWELDDSDWTPSEWETFGPGVTAGSPVSMPGVVVAGGFLAPVSSSGTGRLFPAPRVVHEEAAWWTTAELAVPAGASIGDYVLYTPTGVVYEVVV